MTSVIGVVVNSTCYSDVTATVADWANAVESRYICAANVHSVMEAYDSADFRRVLNSADLVVPDGVPLVWVLRLKGSRGQQRVYGPTLMLHVLESASQNGIPVGFYGGDAKVLELLVGMMQERYKGLNVAYTYSPPFREMSSEENIEVVEQINRSGARILFVGLGCPKQEIWMAGHRDRVNVVMLGVGAAFDFHARVKPQAPVFMQKNGLEWLFRLATEPRRLWRRYFYHNPRFVLLAFVDLLGLQNVLGGKGG
jgi:N-acetylglucosaminyldiphosphoundecaprenol N-acetyl-beta-D-mannosaminyltransferase